MTYDLDLQSLASQDVDLLTAKDQRQRSVGSTDTNKWTDGWTEVIALPDSLMWLVTTSDSQ